MVVTRIHWRADDGRAALGETRDGYVLATDLGVQRVPAWRARLFLTAQTVFRLWMTIRPA